MGAIRVIQIILLSLIVIVHCKDVDGTILRPHRRPSIGGHGGTIHSDTNSNRYLLRGKQRGPIRERRPGGLSYETVDGRDLERRGKVLERRQLRYAKRLGKNIAKFTKKLLKQLFVEGAGKDFVISPLAVHMAQSMLSVGAKGANQKELNRVLGLRGSRFGKGNVHHIYFTLRHRVFKNRQDVNMIDALGVFVKSRIPLEMTFIQTVSQFYNGNFGTLSATPVEDINRWASNQTEGEMSALLAPKSVKPNAEMALVSALCVKGYWNKPFNTVRGPFLTGSGTAIITDMLEQTMLIRKMTVPDLNLVRLQVVLSRDNEKDALVLEIVPMNCTDAIQNALDVLTNKSHHRELQRMTAQPTRLVLPKFWIQDSITERDLKHTLTKLRVRKTFRKRKANFTGISSTAGLYLQKVFHQSAIQINEYGIGCTKAMPYTTTTSSRTRANIHHVELQKSPPEIPSDPDPNQNSNISGDSLPTVTLDKMFVFAIREMRFGTYLTAGVFTGPKGKRNSGPKPHCLRNEH